ncbi:hypothetical protein GN244_ATG13759 [Phytophthora infestans]|uniref:Uncharacterized protein n=1 Tax=Phytophthora infestans TaxID=4787 RepID=A0A833VYM7_PHYIN|nr:hypothetical protein GN244_ATG13759 [Phytophthora infestans]
MKTMESDMAALELDIEAAFEPREEISGGASSSSEEASSSSDQIPLVPPPLSTIDDDDDITSQLLSMLAEEITTGIRHRKALALASPADELIREKNRDSVKRSYYRKIETLGELRAHTEYLRDQYNRLLAQWEDKTERESGNGEGSVQPHEKILGTLEATRPTLAGEHTASRTIRRPREDLVPLSETL